MAALSDRFKAAIEAFVNRLVRRYDYSFPYAYTVQAQNADGTLELTPDDPAKVPGLSNIPPLWGDPGTTCTVMKGARCLIMFANGDPSKPIVLGWEHGSFTMVTHGDGTQPAARQGDLVQSGGPGTVVTLMPLLPIPAPPGAIAPMTPMQCLISFSTIPPTVATADPLYGVISTGSSNVQS